MSTMLPQYLSQLPDSGFTTLLGALAATLLVVLLVLREALRVYNRIFAQRARVMDIAIFPLLFIFGVVVIEHFYSLIFQ
jgi:hypothetical protein